MPVDIPIKMSIFVLVSLWLIYISRQPLRQLASHGFYRFFAWEAILALLLLNIGYWFHDPFSWQQLISWTLLIASAILVLHALWLFRKVGRPDTGRIGESLYALEKTTELVEVGAYRYIRHPMYTSLLLLAWGIFFKSPSWLAGLLAAAATAFLALTARAEEAENLRYFGPAYQEYIRRTRRFFPFLW
jgi:protein-S-isoprenylcysteine O-methyltransferase Ste14